MSLYEIIKFVHVVLAIVAIGFNASYGIWLSRAEKAPEHSAHILRGVKLLDDRFANPAYALLAVTGFTMVFNARIPLKTFWISTSLGIYVVLVLVAAIVYTPTLRRQVVLAEEGRLDSDSYRRLSQRGKLVGILLVVLVLSIEFLMVTKPS